MRWFPEKNDPELERLAALAFDLRRWLFLHSHLRRPPPMAKETPEQRERREAQNAKAVMKWDNETRRLILGQRSADTRLADLLVSE